MSTSPHEAVERHSELTELAGLLDASRPALVVLSGLRGSGKSFVTTEFLQLAQARGWQVTPYRGGRGIRIGAGTTAVDVAHDIGSALGLPAITSARRPLRRLAAHLRLHAERTPTMIVLDPYAPDRSLEECLIRDLFESIRASMSPVIVVVVTRSDLQARLNPDLQLKIVEPDGNEVRLRLRAITAGGYPPVEDAELEHYVEAARSSPRLLASLVAVLPLGLTELTPRTASTPEAEGRD